MKQTASKEDVEVFRCKRAPYVTHFIFNRHHFDSNYFEAKYDFAKTKYSSEEVLGCPELVDFGVVILCSLSTPGLGDYGHYEKKDWEWCAIKLGCLYVTEKTSHMRFTKILRG